MAFNDRIRPTHAPTADKRKIGFKDLFVHRRWAEPPVHLRPGQHLVRAVGASATGMLDILNKHFQNSLRLSKFQSAFVQSANFMGYFVMALPAGAPGAASSATKAASSSAWA